MSPPTPGPRLSRRALLKGAGGLFLGAVGFEALGLTGAFDQRQRTEALLGADALQVRLATLGEGPGVLHLGHSTHLFQLGGRRILTDPWFHDPAFGALVHRDGVGARPEDLGPLDLILISHDHPDHADRRALDRLDKRATVLVATRELAAELRTLGFARVEWVAPEEAPELGGLRVTVTDAHHDVTEVGFVVEGGGASLYFAGDTSHVPTLFDAIAERHRLDLAVLPVDGTRAAASRLWVMDPAQAVDAAARLGARLAMPSHAEATVRGLGGRLLVSTLDHSAEAFARRVLQKGGPGVLLPAVGEALPFPIASSPGNIQPGSSSGAKGVPS